MIQTSAKYKQLKAAGAEYQVQILIDGTVYSEDEIIGVPVSKVEVFGSDENFQVGLAASRTFSCTILNKNQTIPYRAEVIPQVRLVLGEEHSEWLTKGHFFVNSRKADEDNDTISIEAFDALGLLDDEPYPENDGNVRDLRYTFHKAMKNLTADSDTETLFATRPDPVTMGDDPWNYTCRAVLANCAGAYCGNFCMTDGGLLKCISLEAMPSTANPYVVPEEPEKFKQRTPLENVTKIRLINENGTLIDYGSNAGTQLTISVAWAVTEDYYASESLHSTAYYMLPKVQNVQIKPYTAKGVLLDAAVEIGDAIQIMGVTSWVLSQTIYFDAAMSCDIACPSYEEVPLSQSNAYLRKSLGNAQREISKLAKSAIKRWETSQEIEGAYVINQSNYDSIEAAGAWEDNVLYFPIVGL